METKVLFVNPEQAMRCLLVCWQAHVPTHFIGGPATAKTSVHRQFIDRLNAKAKTPFGFWPIAAANHDIGDFFLPVIDHERKRVAHYPTDLIPFDDAEAKGIVMFDDLTKARPELQPFVMNVMLDRFFHGHSLADGVFVSATSNASSDIFNSEVCGALKTRACNLFMSAGAPGFADSWQTWANENGMLPETRAFAKYCSDGLTKDEQFAEWSVFTYRTLAMADRITNACRKANVGTDDIYLPLIAGVLGRASAIKYVEIGKLTREAPAPEEVVAHPDKAPIPENPSVVFALSCALTGYATKANAAAIGRYATRLPTAHALVLIKSVKDKPEAKGAVMLEPVVQKWCTENSAVLT